ncbi:MAG: hypothetical protein M1828_005507 [Chrysothrix sp. TS-e1954]|nr:MAG: hypothetical protein M1828_005507 [Chrysothrix sp. TS-e1954]
MAGVGSSSIRHLTCRSTAALRGPQRRWARVHDVRFVATQQTKERVTDRYRHKLDQKVRQEGLNDIGQLKEAYKDKIQELKKNATLPGANASSNSQATQPSNSPWPAPPPPPAPQAIPQTPSSKPSGKLPGLKTLSSFIDLPKTLELPQKEIEAIWRLRHAHSPQSLCATMKTHTYESIAKTARQHPQFILPGLPRETAETQSQESQTQEGVPIHFMQWAFPSQDTATVMFTHLAEFKLRGEFSQPHTTLTHHLELAGPKGLVLCQGAVVPDRGVSVEEAKWLVMNLQKFYNTSAEVEEADESQTGRELKRRRRQLVEMFSQGHGEFKVESLLEEAERMG